tara:strand:+ start:6585 stop:7268 length:684 start_codon:yes stop_codon:yes gene_type:complete
MKEYIKNSHEESQREYFLYHVPIYIIDRFPSSIKIKNIVNSLKDKINKNFLNGLDAIYIGDFEELNNRNIQSMFKDGAIWISSNNIQNILTEPIIEENILHEIAHLLEEQFFHNLYNDGSLVKEYEGKKQKLYMLLGQDYSISPDLFFSDEHVEKFDAFLHKGVGYDKLSVISAGLFLSPYSITTFREYFASGVVFYLMEDKEYLKEISPSLYFKIGELIRNLYYEN